MAKIPAGVGPKFPQVVVPVGAAGDLSRRKLLPGLFHLCSSGFIPGYRIVGVSLEEKSPLSAVPLLGEAGLVERAWRDPNSVGA